MNVDDKKLLRVFKSLSGEQQQSLLDFAEFLASCAPAPTDQAIDEPLTFPRPAQESVVKAIKRLMATYPMLDRSKLLHETSHYMTLHVMQGKPVVEVIDELEALFTKHYERYKGGE